MQELTDEGRPKRSAGDGMPILDGSVIEALRSFLPPDEAAALLADAVVDIEARVRRLRACLDDADAAGAAKEAHDLVSVGGNCGALALSTMARDIERACKQGVIADALERFTRMPEIATNSVSAIVQLRHAMAEHRVGCLVTDEKKARL
jgi:HPt (histidine-containing phosphotransfer) domain-containing protein